jgi:hypothetical protein
VRFAFALLLILILQAALVTGLEMPVAAHLTGGVTKIVGKYKTQFLVIPKNPLPQENATLNFSIQDLNSNNLSNLTLRITMTLLNQTVLSAPTKLYPYGDFLIHFVFREEGQYTLYLVVFDGGNEYSTYFSISVSRLTRILSDVYSELPSILWLSTLLVLSALLVREIRKQKTARSKALVKGVSRRGRRCGLRDAADKHP